MDKFYHRKQEVERRKQLQANGKIDYNITLDKLIQREDGVCLLCGDPIDMIDYNMTNKGHFIAGENYPSIDHIIPVSKGGTHTWDNVQLAHFYCNSLKQNLAK